MSGENVDALWQKREKLYQALLILKFTWISQAKLVLAGSWMGVVMDVLMKIQ